LDQVAGSVADPDLFPEEDSGAAAFELLLEEDLEPFLLLAEDHRDWQVEWHTSPPGGDLDSCCRRGFRLRNSPPSSWVEGY